MHEGKLNFEPKPTADNEPAITPERKTHSGRNGVFRVLQKDHPEKTASVETRRDCEQEKHEFQLLLKNFEEAHSLEELNAIPDVTPELYTLFSHDRDMSAEQIETALANLTPAEAKKYKTRSPAIKDLKPIVALMNKMEKETDITQPEFDKLRTAYKILSRAVGMINNNKVDHTR